MNNIEITFSIGALWVDVDADNYNAEITENNYEVAVHAALAVVGYDATIDWSNVTTMCICDSAGDVITDSRYNEIRQIIDGIEIDYE